MNNPEIKKNVIENSLVFTNNLGIGDTKIENNYYGIGELLSDLKRQLHEAEKYILDFKPTTALDLLGEIKNAIEKSSLSPINKVSLMAHYYFARGLSLNWLEETSSEPNELFIKAHLLQPHEAKYKERAAAAYLKIEGDTSKAQKCIDEVLENDLYNPRMWALKWRINKEIEIPEIVSKKELFITNAFLSTIDGATTIDSLKVIFKDVSEAISLPSINSENLTYYSLLGIYFLKGEDSPYIIWKEDSKSNSIEISSKIKKGAYILSQITAIIGNSEIRNTKSAKQAIYFNEFAKYKIDPSKRNASRLYDLFVDDEFITNLLGKVLDIALALLDHKLYAEAIEIIDKSKILEKDPTFYRLKAQAFEGLKDEKMVLQNYEKYIAELQCIDRLALRNIVEVISLFLEHFTDEFIITLFKEKIFEQPHFQKLLFASIYRRNHEKKEFCREVANDLLIQFKDGLDLNEKLMIASIFCEIGDLEKAIELLRPILYESGEDQSLYDNYIHLLWITKKNPEELLQLLEKWRKRFTPKIKFLIFEIALYQQVDNYVQIEKICKFGLSIFPDSQQLKGKLIHILHTQKKTEELTEYLDNSLLEFDFPSNQMLHLSNICVKANEIDLGLELAYRQLLKHRQNPDVKMAYWQIGLDAERRRTPIDPEYISIGTIAEIKIDKKIEIIDITEDNYQSNEIVKAIIGKKEGDSVDINTAYHKNKIIIRRVFNKYFGELRRIAFEANSPASGLRMKAIKTSKKEDENYESISKIFQKEFGAEGLIRKLHIEQVLEKYKKREIGFSQICIDIFQGNYFECYEILTQDTNLGINIVPIFLQDISFLKDGTEFVLDLSSILLLQTLSTEIDFNRFTFYVAQSTKDLIIEEIYELENSHKEGFLLTILPEKVTPFFYPENYVDKKLKKMKWILQWVENHCAVDYIDFLLDGENIHDAISEQDNLAKRHILNTLLIANKPNRVLMTDDIFYYKQPIVNLITSESFINHFTPDAWENTKMRMINLNYHGITLTKTTLINTFKKSIIAIKYHPNLFQNSLENLKGSHNPNQQNIDEVIGFIKDLFSDNKVEKALKISITKQLFIAILSVPYFDTSIENLALFNSKIETALNLLGEAPTIVKRSLNEVWRDLF